MSLPKSYKRFCCDRCGYQFIQKISSPIIRCKKCERPCIAIGYNSRKLDPYAQMKLYWLKNPRAWEASIRERHIDNKKGGNQRKQKLPDIVEWN